jgi:hypothetical protein
MLIAILSLGGAMLAATTIAGLLILYQLRATTNSVNSSESIFAADTGIEWSLYDYYCTLDGKPSCPPASVTSTPLSNGAAIAVACYDVNNNPTPCNNTSTMSYAVSKGTSLNTSRAFYLLITASTSTFP